MAEKIDRTKLIEVFSADVHDKWMETKRSKGVTTRKSESGEELMVPYDQLSEAAKDLDRGSVSAVLDAISRSGFEIVRVATA